MAFKLNYKVDICKSKAIWDFGLFTDVCSGREIFVRSALLRFVYTFSDFCGISRMSAVVAPFTKGGFYLATTETSRTWFDLCPQSMVAASRFLAAMRN